MQQDPRLNGMVEPPSNEHDDHYPEEHEDLQWTKRQPQNLHAQVPKLDRPVLIPTAMPSIQATFIRAWAPELEKYDVHMEEFLQFIDHLNVCKTASPALQVVNLAGTAVGFAPFHFAFLAGMAIQASAAGGMYAVARVRITRYLVRANKEYFVPRGLLALVAKQENLDHFVHQPPSTPLLSPLSQFDTTTQHRPKLYERRLDALSPYISPLSIHQSETPSTESKWLDKLSAKAVAHKTERQEKKALKKEEKGHEKEPKEHAKFEEKRRELEEEIRKIESKEGGNEEKKHREIAELEEEIEEEREKYEVKTGKSVKDEGKSAGKFLWVVVTNYDPSLVEGKNL